MSFGWMLIVNGAIGVVMYFVMIAVLVLCGEKEFGNDAVDSGFDDTFDLADQGYSEMREDIVPLMKAISWIATIFAWEIIDLILFYLVWNSMRSRSNKK